MPSLQLVGGMVLALTLGANPTASNILFTATVKAPEAEVRSGPSDKFYPTNRLRQGDVVEVVKEAEGGWLAIKPPPGSLSYIKTSLVRQLNARTWAVVSPNDAPVLIGSRVVNQKPTAVGVHVKQGCLFVSVWEPLTADDGAYLPVEPPPGELRYVRGEDVSKNLVPGEASSPAAAAAPPALPSAASTLAAPPPPAPGGGFAQPRAIAPAAALPPAPAATALTAEPLWNQAQEAERAGRTAEAERAYTALGQELSRDPSKHDLAMQCYNRAYFLRETGRGGAAPEAPSAGQGAAPLRPVATDPYRPQGSSQAAYPPAQQQQQSNYAASASGPVRTSDPGMLRHAYRNVDSRPTYMLVSNNGYLTFVTAEPGVDLESYLDRAVRVSGPMVYRTDLRAIYITAQRVIPQP